MYFAIAVCTLWVVGCTSGKSLDSPSEEVLALYQVQSAVSDPGEHVGMYSELPRSEERLCELIKSQLVHPFD